MTPEINVADIFKITQEFLNSPPLVVWGSGATIPFELPCMGALNEKLKSKIPNFNPNNENLEIELGNEKYQNEMPEIRKVIWEEVNLADELVLNEIITNKAKYLDGVKSLIEKFIEAHPQMLNIVTTNYDRVLEHIMSYYDIAYTDGFNGRVLSSFDENLFKTKSIVNLIKVHGSLNWSNIDGDIRYIKPDFNKINPQIIAPGKGKYQEAYSSPYRELIQRADSAINNASSFLVVGFGFNDEHLTPKIKSQVKKGIPIVLITKKVTTSTYQELKNAKKYIFFEELLPGKTKITFKKNTTENESSVELNNNFWQLTEFMEIL